MKLVKSLLLGSAAGLAVVSGAQAADLPAAAPPAPVEYVRVCTAYGAGFFYIPGTDTCLRVSGRARFEAGYINSDNRRINNGGDLSGFIGLMRLNVDARTQTDYGTLRTFLRLDAASRTGHTKSASGTNLRGGYAFTGTGQDQINRVQNFINVDKAFVQFAGLTAGRASSFFDFYANDFEIMGVAHGSNLPSTNLLAYTQKMGEGWSATLSMEDPNFRKNPLYSTIRSNATDPGFASSFGLPLIAPTPVIISRGADGDANSIAFIDAVQRSRMPDFVGSLRYDAAWGSAQLSGAVKDVNTGGFLGGILARGVGTTDPNTAQSILASRGISSGSQTEYGWAVQGGVKFNMPFIAPGDAIYLQGAYGEGANMYTGITRATASYLSNASVYTGNPFNQYLSDAVVNPLTGKLELATSWTVTASYLHYWSPQWRSAFFSSYGEIEFSKAARSAVGLTSGLTGVSGSIAPPSPIGNADGFALSPSIRDTNQITAGTSLIWSPVKDLDIGVEGAYVRTALKNGKATNSDKGASGLVNIAGDPLYTRGSHEYYRAAFRVQRDF